jgi:hypothetical protein
MVTAKINTGLRLDPTTLARVDAYLDRLRREPGRGTATQHDAIRTLIDLGLASVEPKKGKR